MDDARSAAAELIGDIPLGEGDEVVAGIGDPGPAVGMDYKIPARRLTDAGYKMTNA